MGSDILEQQLTKAWDRPGLPLAHRIRDPQNASVAGRPCPCLILLHGVGSNEGDLAGIAARLDPRLVVMSLRGPLTVGPDRYAWFNFQFTASGPVINADQAEQSRQMLVEFIENLPAAYDIDPERIWIGGFSQGGILSASVALTRPDKVAGFAILSGRILPEISPLSAAPEQLRTLQAFASHGLQDNILPVDHARNSRRLLTEKQVALQYREYAAGHELNDAMEHDFAQWLAQQLDASEMESIRP